MHFTFQSGSEEDQAGTSGKGYIRHLNLSEMKFIFGEPIYDYSKGFDSDYDGDEKVTVLWVLRICIGDDLSNIITIYDYKGDKWHIGGNDDKKVVCNIVKQILKRKGIDHPEALVKEM